MSAIVANRKALVSFWNFIKKQKEFTEESIYLISCNRSKYTITNINAVLDATGKTLLFYACEIGNILLIDYLIKTFSDLKFRLFEYIDASNYIKDPLCHLIINGKNELIMFLLSKFSEITEITEDNYVYDIFTYINPLYIDHSNSSILEDVVFKAIKYLTSFQDIQIAIHFIFERHSDFMEISENDARDTRSYPRLNKLLQSIVDNEFYSDYISVTTNQYRIGDFIAKYNCTQLWFDSPLKIFLEFQSPLHRIIYNDGVLIDVKIKLITEFVQIDNKLLLPKYKFYDFGKLLCDPINFIISIDDHNKLCHIDDPINKQLIQLFETVIQLHVKYNTNYQELFKDREEIIRLLCVSYLNNNSYKYIQILIKYGFKIAMDEIFELLKTLRLNYVEYPEDVSDLIELESKKIEEPPSTVEVFETPDGHIITAYKKSEMTESEKRMHELQKIVHTSKLDHTLFASIPDSQLKPLPEKIYIYFGKQCIQCNKDATFYCSKCELIRYCSVKCQRSNWAHHKHICCEIKETVKEIIENIINTAITPLHI